MKFKLSKKKLKILKFASEFKNRHCLPITKIFILISIYLHFQINSLDNGKFQQNIDSTLIPSAAAKVKNEFNNRQIRSVCH